MIEATSTCTPGPIVELIDTFLMKVPLAPDGLARFIRKESDTWKWVITEAKIPVD